MDVVRLSQRQPLQNESKHDAGILYVQLAECSRCSECEIVHSLLNTK